MKKSVKKEYEHKRSYDYVECSTHLGRKLTKRRAHKRLRRQLNKVKSEDYEATVDDFLIEETKEKE